MSVAQKNQDSKLKTISVRSPDGRVSESMEECKAAFGLR
jgi:hypothetical protein